MEALSVADDSIELEAKRKEDSSWHPCIVSLSSSGDSLIVNFGSQELKDMMLNKEEVLARLRFRSMPLQVDDCCHIEEGERVLVNTKLQSKDFFHDAEVEKVDRIRHSKRGCRCSFMIKWLDNDLEGQTLAVPSSSVMKLATKSISDHPIIHTLLKPEKDTDLSYSSPFMTILDDSDAEKDLNKLLQKQIEQISNLADAPEKDFLDDFLLRKKVLNNGQTPHNSTAESNACIPAVPDNRNHLKRITCSKTKLQVDIETKYQSGTAASIQEEFIQNRSRLSPLASRAALASSLLTAKKCLDMEFSSCMTADMFMKGKHSSEILAISIPLVSDASHAISPLISTQGDASCKPPSCIPTKVRGNENKTSVKINRSAEDKTSSPAKVTVEKVISEIAMTAEHAIARDKNSSVLGDVNARSTTPMRLTRLAMRKGAVFPNECIEVKICTDNKKRRISGNKNKLCHSAIRQVNENLGDEENNSTHIIDSGSSERNIAILESDVSATKTAKDASTPCKNAQSGRRDQGKKRKAVHPDKQGRRFSPRNHLPRTRSQNKSRHGKKVYANKILNHIFINIQSGSRGY
ncbi:hypothetical protein CXB51_023209 [Gossypium anomalum]|uniref:SAWADEE domain-containing protein n=1 Tax=Gossypium anomalum TaxID=47600 RepID=A0A8J6CUL2_9ROSI|nr:hypothetical protein CXB51_023209 [Gossypium anomalum]